MPASPPEHTKWKPGQSGNPHGREKSFFTQDKVKLRIGRLFEMSKEQMQLLVMDPQSHMLDVMLAAIMVRAVKDADATRMNFLLDRSIGKCKEAPESPKMTYDPRLDQIPREKIVELLRAVNE